LFFSVRSTKVEDFPGNSHKKAREDNPEPQKKVEKVVTGKVVTRKPPVSRRLASVLFGADAKSSWLAVVQDVLVPAAKDMAADALSQGFERMIYGEARSTPRRRSGLLGGFQQGPSVSYNRFSTNPVGRASGLGQRNDDRRPMSRQSRASHNFDEIILATRAEAEAVLEQMYEVLSKYDVATVADLYELVGITGEYTDEKYGWTDLRGSDVTRIREGYLLNLPKPDVID
jgi:hypothetical protein